MHSDQLSQTAGLKLGRDQKSIRTCVDSVSSCLIIHDIGADISLISILIISERILILRITCTQYNNLCVLIHDLRND